MAIFNRNLFFLPEGKNHCLAGQNPICWPARELLDKKILQNKDRGTAGPPVFARRVMIESEYINSLKGIHSFSGLIYVSGGLPPSLT